MIAREKVKASVAEAGWKPAVPNRSLAIFSHIFTWKNVFDVIRFLFLSFREFFFISPSLFFFGRIFEKLDFRETGCRSI